MKLALIVFLALSKSKKPIHLFIFL